MIDRHRRNLFRAAVWTLVSRRHWRAVVLLSAVLVFAAHDARAQQPVRYVYDDLGRLIAVVDPTGEAATYVYDAVGNVVSITRTSAAVKVLGLSPYAGPVGATVTIAGTGFSTVATDNVVTFNGTAAQVLSATGTQLVTVVPTAASTGTVSVVTPLGSGASAAPFTVTTSTAPQITGFSPTIGVPGTTVAVDGANFDALLTNNRLLFNTTHAAIASGTATALSTSVPAGATSGRLSVKTPGGSASSSADFFVPPSPYVASDVQTTGRIAFGEVKPVAIASANKIALIVFDGVKGQRVSLRLSATSISGTYVRIRRPDDMDLVSQFWMSTDGAFVDTKVLPATGTYTIVLDPEGSYTGSTTLTLYDVPPDASGTIAIGGSSTTVTITTPGQNAAVTFTGTTGQRVSLRFTSVSVSGTYVTIRKPDGTDLVSLFWMSSDGTFVDTRILPANGTYTILINPESRYTGSMTLTLYDVPADGSGTIAIGGSSTTVTIATPGQNAAVTFTGTTGQRVSLRFTSVSVLGTYVTIRKPDGTDLVSLFWMSSDGTFVDQRTLPASGTYTILINPEGSYTGSMTLTLYDVPADASGTIAIGGSPTTMTMTTPGQNAAVTFTGTTGQRVSLRFTSVSVSGTYVTIRKPDSTDLVSLFWMSSDGAFVDTRTLPANGTYTIQINPEGSYTGSMTLTLYDVADVTGTLDVGGAAVPITISTPGQNAMLTFSGTQSQQVTVRVTGNTLYYPTVKLLRPDGTTQTSTSAADSSFNLTTQTLATTGTYTVVVDPAGSNTGSLSISVTSP